MNVSGHRAKQSNNVLCGHRVDRVKDIKALSLKPDMCTLVVIVRLGRQRSLGNQGGAIKTAEQSIASS